ncbi:BBP7 family outer membrane beta-barrel protein [Blastopirellula marina]|uniref:BBP7 family outer membrane beta-barrel protein n=1 Tax=Blastopirellula marina TaxID=124 RepID=A0A2S8GLC8_9BACT|nr:BBP7 family outer membrane beta-barrel protein [Blastopirellula marina]PQO45243.1 hypothetical protein C5Y93_14870 [Blastopirellula marina]
MNIPFRWAALFAVAACSLTGWAEAQTFSSANYSNPAITQGYRPNYSAPPVNSTWAAYGKESMPSHATPHVPTHPNTHPGHTDPSVLSYYDTPSSDCYSLTGPGSEEAYCGPMPLAPLNSRCGWFGSAGGLVMTRDHENFLPFSYATSNEANQLVTNRDAAFDVAGGVEGRFGRYFNCGQSSLEFVFWTIIPGTQSYQLLGSDVAGDLNGIYNWDQLNYNGNTADAFVNDAMVHRIRRSYEFQNYELNWNTYLTPQGCGALEVQGIAGFRVFRFGETLDFGADTVDTVFTGDPAEIHYNIDVDNRLYGFQLGTLSQYRFSPCWSLNTKILGGLFANDISHRSFIGGAAGTAVVNNGPNNGTPFDVAGSDTSFALMGELDFGLTYRPTCNWQIGAGYRAMGVSGVALASNQLFFDLRGVNDVATIEKNGDLILHGGYFNLSYNY